jgi:hypothetical protein
MFQMSQRPDEIMHEAINTTGLDEETIELTKRNYSFDKEENIIGTDLEKLRTLGWLYEGGCDTVVKEEIIHSPFTVLFARNEIGKYKITKSYLKHKSSSDQKNAVYGYEKFAFFIIKSIEPVSPIILFVGYCYALFIGFVALAKTLQLNNSEIYKIHYYDYITVLIVLLISYWRVYFYGKEKNLRNKLKVLKLKFEISCREWVRELNLHFSSLSDSSRNYLKNRIEKEILSFFYSSQFSDDSLTKLFNEDLRKLCDYSGLSYKDIIYETLISLHYLKEEQKGSTLEKQKAFWSTSRYVLVLNKNGIPEKEKQSNGGDIPDKSFYGGWLKQNKPEIFLKGYEEWIKSQK